MKFILFILMSAVTLFSSTKIVGNVILVDGNVKVKSEGSIKKKKAIVGLTIYSGDLISSSKGGHLKLKLSDDSILILDEHATLHFNSVTDAEQLSGKVLYKITSRDAKNSLKIKTPFAVIGIKGTTFIVNAIEKESSISLKEGLIGVSSIKEEFSLYRKEVLAAFKKFRESQEKEFQKTTDKQLTEFERFKQGINNTKVMPPKPEITKAFDLEAGNKITFNGKEVRESTLDTENKDPFKDFENFFNIEK